MRAREIISETDLIAALESGKVAGAALDVFSVEPLPADHPFRKQPNLILTPHLGASTEEAQEKCGIEVAEVIAGYLLTGEVRNAVNLPYLDAKTYEQGEAVFAAWRGVGQIAFAAFTRDCRSHLHHLRRQRAAIAEC
ncbi:MAG: NAD(P)-dependent oxidoreductase [Limisphaerales bacterium]